MRASIGLSISDELGPSLFWKPQRSVSFSQHVTLSETGTLRGTTRKKTDKKVEVELLEKLDSFQLYDVIQILLTDPKVNDRFILCFLYCYRALPTLQLLPTYRNRDATLLPEQLLDILVYRLLSPPNHALAQLREDYDENLTGFISRVNTILTKWIKIIPSDFIDGQLQRRVTKLLESTKDTPESVIETLTEAIKSMEAAASQTKEEVIDVNDIPGFPAPVQKPQIDPSLMAVEMFLIDLQFMSKMTPRDLLGRCHNEFYFDGINSRLANYNEKLCQWINLQSIRSKNVEEQCEVLTYWICVGVYLLGLNDFQGLFTVMRALTSPIYSISSQKSWEVLPRHVIKIFEVLKEWTSDKENHENYRKTLSDLIKRNSSCVASYSLMRQEITTLRSQMGTGTVAVNLLQNMSKVIDDMYIVIKNPPNQHAVVTLSHRLKETLSEFGKVELGQLKFNKGKLNSECSVRLETKSNEAARAVLLNGIGSVKMMSKLEIAQLFTKNGARVSPHKPINTLSATDLLAKGSNMNYELDEEGLPKYLCAIINQLRIRAEKNQVRGQTLIEADTNLDGFLAEAATAGDICTDAQVLCTLFLEFINNQKDSIIPTKFYKKIAKWSEIEDESVKDRAFVLVMAQLPTATQKLLSVVINWMWEICRREEIDTIDQICQRFGPAILWSPREGRPKVAFDCVRHLISKWKSSPEGSTRVLLELCEGFKAPISDADSNWSSAHIDTLIECSMNEVLREFSDPKLLETTIYTHRFYLPSERLLDIYAKAYETEKDEKKKRGILYVMEKWLQEEDLNGTGLDEDIGFAKRLDEFLVKNIDFVDKSHKRMFKTLKNYRRRLLPGAEEMDLKGDGVMNLYSISEIAQQMHNMDVSTMREIHASELMDDHFEIPEKSPNVSKILNRTQKWKEWIISDVLREKDMEKRIKILNRFICLGTKLIELRSYNACAAVATAITHPSVSRLYKTWAASTEEASAGYKLFLHLFSPDENNEYEAYMKAHDSTKKSRTPWLWLEMKKLKGNKLVHTKNEESNSTFSEYTKMRSSTTVIVNTMEKLRCVGGERRMKGVAPIEKFLGDIEGHVQLMQESEYTEAAKACEQ